MYDDYDDACEYADDDYYNNNDDDVWWLCWCMREDADI